MENFALYISERLPSIAIAPPLVLFFVPRWKDKSLVALLPVKLALPILVKLPKIYMAPPSIALFSVKLAPIIFE